MGGERVRLFVKAQVCIIVFQTNALNTRDVDLLHVNANSFNTGT